MKDATYLVLLIDRSGSMASIKSATQESINGFLHQQKEKNDDEMTVTLIQFDDEYEVVYAHKPIQDAPEFMLSPRGSTALLDAMGKAIVQTGDYLRDLPENERPQRVVMVVVTDGLENMSREYTKARVNEMVKHQQDVYNWAFVYLGANQDAIAEGGNLGVAQSHAATYAATAASVTRAVNMMSHKVGAVRSSKSYQSLDFSDQEREELQKKS